MCRNHLRSNFGHFRDHLRRQDHLRCRTTPSPLCSHPSCFWLFLRNEWSCSNGLWLALIELGRILLVPYVFSRKQLNSETSKLRRWSFPFPKEWVYWFRRFRRLQLKSEALKPSCHEENTSERESFRSLPAKEEEGLEGLLSLPFLEDSTKRTGFWSLPKTEDRLLKREGTKRVRP